MGWRAAVLAAATAAVVVIGAAPAAAQDPCGVPGSSSWTATEAAIWQQLCASEWADLNAGGEALDPKQPDGWDERRRVSSAFIEQLLTQPYAAAIDRHGVRLRGVWLSDGLDIHEAAVGFPLRCQSCRIAGLLADNAVIDGTLDLRGSAVEGDASLLDTNIGADLVIRDGSVVTGTMKADGLTVAGSVHLGAGSEFLGAGSEFNDIRLLDADIGGTLDISNGSAVSGTLNANRFTVAGSVFLHNGSKFTDINLSGASIGSNLEMHNGSVVSGTLNADRLTVAGSVFLNDRSQFNDVNVLGADIGSNLEVDNGSVVSGTLNADGLTVAGSVFLRDGSKFNDVLLPGADIGGNLEVHNGSTVSGALTATDAKVADNVVLVNGSRFNDVNLFGASIGGLLLLDGTQWESGALLSLAQARAGGIWTDERAESWPDRLRLDGFTYQQWTRPDPRTLGADWFTDVWLARLDRISPGPYNQLAAVMDASGHPTIAADIRYRRSHAERLQVPWTRADRWGREAHWLVLGYGYRPWRALGWFFAVWLTGFLAYWLRLHPAPALPAEDPGEAADRPGRLRRWRGRIATAGRVRPVKRDEWSAGQAALYSLDRLLPAVKLVDPDEIPKRTRAQQAWAVMQILLGWLLTLFIVGWLGSLLVQT